MFDKIQNPITGKWVSIFGNTGKRILNNYLSQMGGSFKFERFPIWERSKSKRLTRRKCLPAKPPTPPPYSSRVRNRLAQKRLSQRKRLVPINEIQHCGPAIPKPKDPLAPIGQINNICKQCKRVKLLREFSPRQRRAINRNLPGTCIRCTEQSRISELVRSGRRHIERGRKDRPIIIKE